MKNDVVHHIVKGKSLDPMMLSQHNLSPQGSAHTFAAGESPCVIVGRGAESVTAAKLYENQ